MIERYRWIALTLEVIKSFVFLLLAGEEPAGDLGVYGDIFGLSGLCDGFVFWGDRNWRWFLLFLFLLFFLLFIFFGLLLPISHNNFSLIIIFLLLIFFLSLVTRGQLNLINLILILLLSLLRVLLILMVDILDPVPDISILITAVLQQFIQLLCLFLPYLVSVFLVLLNHLV